VSAVWLARTPDAVSGLLIEAADNVVAAAVTLHYLCESGPDDAARKEHRRLIVFRQTEGERVKRLLLRELAQRTAIGPDRGRLLALTEALLAVGDRLTALAWLEDHVVERGSRTAATGVLRDLARSSARAIRDLEAAVEVRQSRWEAGERLIKEGHAVLRETDADVRATADVLSVLRIQQWTRAVRRALAAYAELLHRWQAAALSRD
jgi:hypothetical protein